MEGSKVNDHKPKLNRNVISEEQRSHVLQLLSRWELPFHIRVGEVKHQKTASMLNYCQYLCRAYGKHHGIRFEQAKNECKAHHGTVTVYTSTHTGDREILCKSFGDYSAEEAEAFILNMEKHLSENNIEFIASEK